MKLRAFRLHSVVQLETLFLPLLLYTVGYDAIGGKSHRRDNLNLGSSDRLAPLGTPFHQFGPPWFSIDAIFRVHSPFSKRGLCLDEIGSLHAYRPH